MCTFNGVPARTQVNPPKHHLEGLMAVTLALRPEGLKKIRRLYAVGAGGELTDKRLAELIGIDPGQLSRVIQNKSAPGPQFIAGAIEAFGADCFEDLFMVIERSGRDAA